MYNDAAGRRGCGSFNALLLSMAPCPHSLFLSSSPPTSSSFFSILNMHQFIALHSYFSVDMKPVVVDQSPRGVDFKWRWWEGAFRAQDIPSSSLLHCFTQSVSLNLSHWLCTQSPQSSLCMSLEIVERRWDEIPCRAILMDFTMKEEEKERKKRGKVYPKKSIIQPCRCQSSFNAARLSSLIHTLEVVHHFLTRLSAHQREVHLCSAAFVEAFLRTQGTGQSIRLDNAITFTMHCQFTGIHTLKVRECYFLWHYNQINDQSNQSASVQCTV